MDKELETKLFREGMKAGIWLFAVWKDGKQVVGTREIPLKEAWLKADNGGYDHMLEIKKKVDEIIGGAKI